jgi:two-component system nitrate/nitrite response regulator NarL
VLETSEPTIRILLLDDHTIFRQGLVNLLNNEPGLELKLHCGGTGEGLLLLSIARPDIVLLDADLGNERGVDFLMQARRNGFEGPVLILTAGISRDEEETLKKHGISGILRKDVSVDVLSARIREAARVHGTGNLIHRTDAGPKAAVDGKRQKPLTLREAEVLRFVIEGQLNKQIAHELGCSESAVKGVIQQLFRKSGTSTRSQLVRAALEQYSGQI